MKEDIRKLEKIILNMRPNGVIQTQIVEALMAILCIFRNIEENKYDKYNKENNIANNLADSNSFR